MPAAHKSAISVGLLYIPVGLYKTTRETGISFNQLCKDSKERIRHKKYFPSCDKEIKNEDIYIPGKSGGDKTGTGHGQDADRVHDPDH